VVCLPSAAARSASPPGGLLVPHHGMSRPRRWGAECGGALALALTPVVDLAGPHGRQHLLSSRVTGLTGTGLSLISLQLWQEIQAQGYQGSAQTIYRYLRGLRKKRRVIWKPEVPQAPLQDFSAHEAVWLFARAPDALEEKEQATLTAICQASETAKTTYQLVQEFRHLLHQREGEKLDAWLAKCTASQIREFQSFVQGIERDKAAVVAGLTLSQNNDHVA
jgi:Transposase